MKADRERGTEPAHQVVSRELRAGIAAGEYRDSGKLPTEAGARLLEGHMLDEAVAVAARRVLAQSDDRWIPAAQTGSADRAGDT